MAQGAQGVRDAGHRARRLPPLLAALLHVVPHGHHLRHLLLPMSRFVLAWEIAHFCGLVLLTDLLKKSKDRLHDLCKLQRVITQPILQLPFDISVQ